MSEGVAGDLPASQPPQAGLGGGEVHQQLRRPPADLQEAVARYCGRQVGWAAAELVLRAFSGNTATAVDKATEGNHKSCRKCDSPYFRPYKQEPHQSPTHYSVSSTGLKDYYIQSISLYKISY